MKAAEVTERAFMLVKSTAYNHISDIDPEFCSFKMRQLSLVIISSAALIMIFSGWEKPSTLSVKKGGAFFNYYL